MVYINILVMSFIPLPNEKMERIITQLLVVKSSNSYTVGILVKEADSRPCLISRASRKKF